VQGAFVIQNLRLVWRDVANYSTFVPRRFERFLQDNHVLASMALARFFKICDDVKSLRK
jgi:hypothetical protein